MTANLPAQFQTQTQLVFETIDRLESGATADEVTQVLHRYLPYGASREISSLARQGKIVETGTMRQTRSGKWAKVYVTIKPVNGARAPKEIEDGSATNRDR